MFPLSVSRTASDEIRQNNGAEALEGISKLLLKRGLCDPPASGGAKVLQPEVLYDLQGKG